MRWKAEFLLLGVALPILFAACAPRGPATYPVQGTVTYDGQPIKVGDVLFIPNDASLAPEGGSIIDGKFAMLSKAGTCRVRISALDINENTEWISGSPIAANFIPPIYNEETILTAEVVAGGKNQFTFDLQKPQ